jgi:putative transposase
MDITYMQMARGFVYVAAVVDWFSRRVLAWRVSITMEVDFCLEAVEEALARHGKPPFSHRSGFAVTSAIAFGGERDRDPHGRAWLVAGQCLCRASIAIG